jgi:hypothetical protein
MPVCVRVHVVASLCMVKLCRVVRVGRFRGVASRDDDPFNPITRALQSERRQPKSTGCVRLQYDRQRTATQATSKSHCLASRALGRVAAAGSSPALGGRRLREAVRPLSHQVGAVLQRAVRRCNAAVLRCRTREQHIGSAQPFRPMEEATEPFHRSLTVAGGGGSAGSSGGQERSWAGGRWCGERTKKPA